MSSVTVVSTDEVKVEIDADSTIYTENLTLKGEGDGAEIKGNIVHEYGTDDKTLHIEDVTVTGGNGHHGHDLYGAL